MRKLRISAVRNILGLAVIIMLPVACGGGGSGGGGSSSYLGEDGFLGERTSPQLNELQNSESGGGTVATPSFRIAADTPPSQGSVTQSSNRDASGITADTAVIGVEPNPDGGWVYSFSLSGASGWNLSSNEAGIVEFLSAEEDDLLDSLGALHGAIMARDTGNELALVFMASNRSSGTDDDYLSIGLWGRIDASSTPAVSVGAFADGGMFDYGGQSPTGTARYEGVSVAMYAIDVEGDDAAGIDPLVESGLAHGEVRLEANFASNTISGTISNFQIEGVENDGQEFEVEEGPAFTIMLDSANIDSQGYFLDGMTTLELDDDAPGRVMQDYNRIVGDGRGLLNGRWGGQFFGDAVGDMNQPGLVGGTWGVENSALYMLGTFAAGHEDRN